LHVQLEKKSAKSLEQKRENVQEFNADEVLKVIQEQKSSEKWAYRTIALLLASGVRRIELFKVSQFKKDPEREDWIIQVGVAKDKEKRLAIKACRRENCKRKIRRRRKKTTKKMMMRRKKRRIKPWTDKFASL